MCSTPDGIIEGNTCASGTSRRHGMRAQRLTASSRETPHHYEPRATGYMCSTPDGMIEGNTCVTAHLVPPAEMCSTPDGIIEGNTMIASLVAGVSGACSTPDGIIEGNTLRSGSRLPSPPGAQRLTASSRET